jgi:hypothetical protein
MMLQWKTAAAAAAAMLQQYGVQFNRESVQWFTEYLISDIYYIFYNNKSLAPPDASYEEIAHPWLVRLNKFRKPNQPLAALIWIPPPPW